MPIAAAADIRAGLDHPVIDADGHQIEYLPLVRDLLVEDAGEDLGSPFDLVLGAGSPGTCSRGSVGTSASPARRGGACRGQHPRPGHRHAPRVVPVAAGRAGIDVAVLYPTYGLIPTALDDEALRVGLARAFNRATAELYAGPRRPPRAGRRDPDFSPEEALAELDHAVGELGLRAVVMGGVVPRPVAGRGGAGRPLDRHPRPRLGPRLRPAVAPLPGARRRPTFHASGFGWGRRTSTTNYVYNHLGNFAAAGEATCRSLLLGGVLPGSPTCASPSSRAGRPGRGLCSATSSATSRSGRASRRPLRPPGLDRDALRDLIAEHGPPAFVDRADGSTRRSSRCCPTPTRTGRPGRVRGLRTGRRTTSSTCSGGRSSSAARPTTR